MATIGVLPKAGKELENLKNHFGFNSEKDAALFAMAYALSNELPHSPVTNKITKWGTSSFNVAELEGIFSVFYPDFSYDEQTMISLMEGLIHAGLYELTKIVDENKYVKLSDLLPLIES